jgi:hypothetical protein
MPEQGLGFLWQTAAIPTVAGLVSFISLFYGACGRARP